MADDDWEKRDFDDVGKAPVKVTTDKWDGEDEDDNVKDNWDDEDEDKSTETSAPTVAATQVKKNKKKLANKLAERQEKEAEQQLKARLAQMTPEEREAEKLRHLRMLEDDQIQQVKAAFGASSEIDTTDPLTKDDFDELKKKIVNDLRRFEKRAPFEDFVEDLIQDLCLSLPSKSLRKVKTRIEAVYFEKSKTEKSATTKGKSTKAKLRVDGDKTLMAAGGYADDIEDFDDFM